MNAITHVRPPAVAGSFYPADASSLRKELARCLDVPSLAAGPVGAGVESGLSTAQPLHGREAVLRETPVPPPSNPTLRAFIDMHDLGDMLMAAGFADPVMDMEMISLTYSHPRKFLADQRHLGVRNALLGQQAWQTWREIFANWQQDAQGRFPMNFEIIYGHAWKPAPRASNADHAVMHFHRRETVKI